VRRAIRLADLFGQLWRQAGNGTTSRPGWHWPGVDPHVADQLPVPGRHRITSRSRVLSEQEIRRMWPILRDGVPGSRVGRAPRLALMLSLATGLRIGAIALCRVADLYLDPEHVVGARDCGPTLRLPARISSAPAGR
jgi:integrase